MAITVSIVRMSGETLLPSVRLSPEASIGELISEVEDAALPDASQGLQSTQNTIVNHL